MMCGEGTLASPSSWPHEHLPPPAGATQASLPHIPTTPAFRGRFFITSLGKRLRPRRGGGGGCGGWGRLRRPRRSPRSPGPTPHGRRKRPHPTSPPPPPLRGRLLPPQKPPPESPTPAPTG